MKLRLVRDAQGEDCTFGKLYINGVYECETLEDTDRELEDEGNEKIAGETAIPRGTYNVIIDFSQRFGKEMPHVLDVPQFTGIRIHPGNKAADTEGCILLGLVRTYNGVGRSVLAFNAFFPKLSDALDRGETVTLEVV